jgi:hypothetical protein
MLRLLDEGWVLGHPCVVGELALTTVRNVGYITELLQNLESAVVADPDELLTLIGLRHLYGCGLSYVDVHLLASVLLTPATRLWSRRPAVASVARRLGVLVDFDPMPEMHEVRAVYQSK